MSGFEAVDAAGIELGEHPIWDPERERVGWVDVFAGQLRWVAGEGIDIWDFPAPLGAAAMRRGGGVVAAAGSGIHFRDAAGGTDREPIIGLLSAGVRFNDGACDPAGNFLCGTMATDGAPGRGRLYRVTPDGGVETLASGISESNGLSWSPDGETMYYVDSAEPVVRRYRYRADAVPERERNLCSIDGGGTPDGICADAEAAIWIAIWERGELWRVSPAGETLAIVQTPVSRPTCPSFGAPGLKRLFLATAWEGMSELERRGEPYAGHLLAYDPPVPGIAAPAFAG
jgi:sugar lactone lactonase YvrE